MSRMHYTVAMAGLFLWGCADSSTPTATNPSGDATTVTANKPPVDEPSSEETTAPEEQAMDVAPSPDESLLPPGETAEEATDARAVRELKEAGEAVSDWSAETKDELIKKAEEKLADLNTKLDELKAQAADASDDAKARWDEQIEELEQKRTAFTEKLDELKSSGEAAWQEMATGLKNAWAKLEQSSKDAASELK